MLLVHFRLSSFSVELLKYCKNWTETGSFNRQNFTVFGCKGHSFGPGTRFPCSLLEWAFNNTQTRLTRPPMDFLSTFRKQKDTTILCLVYSLPVIILWDVPLDCLVSTNPVFNLKCVYHLVEVVSFFSTSSHKPFDSVSFSKCMYPLRSFSVHTYPIRCTTVYSILLGCENGTG